ncbi:MAG: succinyl-CoA--3-ketoacid-CoA transferase [Chloroflexi bacterium]|nr:succinyl-CoA--3-ketoacid-CoA transferase [Chloroflexota bacterium]
MKERLSREAMAMRIAKELFDGAVVNLGIGIPTLVSSFVPEGMTVIYHTENGALGFGPVVTAEDMKEKADIDLVNASGQYVTPQAATEHTTKDGKPKIVKTCSVALTAPECVDLIVTDIAVIEVKDKRLWLRELAPGWTVDEVQALTEPTLRVAPDLKDIELL